MFSMNDKNKLMKYTNHLTIRITHVKSKTLNKTINSNFIQTAQHDKLHCNLLILGLHSLYSNF